MINDENLIVAAEKGDFESVVRLVAQGCDPNVTNGKNETPLGASTFKGHFRIVKFLLAKGADIEQEGNEKGQTPLLFAAAGGHFDVVKELLQQGASIDHADCAKNTPLICAAYGGHVGVVSILIKNGANLDIQNLDGINPW